MNRVWISMVAAAAVCMTGAVSTAVAQQVYYPQPTSSCQQCYSTPQYQTYESVSQPIYQDGYSSSASYPSGTVYQSPVSVFNSQQNLVPTHYAAPVVSNSFVSGQIIHSDPVYYNSSLNTNSVGYSGVVSSSYPTQGSVQVYSAPQVYQPQTTQSYSSAGYSPTVQATVSYSGNHYASTTNPQPGLAQSKAVQAAQMGVRDHIGGGLGGAKFEGVGWSNQSPQSAIQNCCYWGQRSPAQIGVSRSQDGCWYACVLYH